MASLVVMLFVITPVLAMAGSEPQDHLALVDAETPYERASISRTGVKVLEDYGSFVMVKGTENQLSKLPNLRDMDDRSFLDLTGYRFDTNNGLPDLPKSLKQSAPDTGNGYFLVQFTGPIKTTWRNTVKDMGAQPLYYIPNFAYIMRMDVDLKDDIATLPYVTWVDHYQPAFKVSREVWEFSGIVRMDIALHEGEEAGPVIDALIDKGAEIEVASLDQINPTIQALVPFEAIVDIARMNQVWWMEIHRIGFLPPNDPAQWITQSNVTDYYPFYDNGIHGENMTIGNADTGIDVGHLAFHDANRNVQYSAPAANTPPDTQHRKVVNYWTFGNSVDGAFGGHGTRTSGVNAGDNDANNGNPQYHGIAYKAKISFQDVYGSGDDRPADKGQMYQKTMDDGGWIHSGSLICPAGGAYNSETIELDQFLWNNKDFLGVIANHNYGGNDVPNTVCDLASAKSTMSMGAAYNSPNQNGLHDYTGRGPTDDGRLKPTVSSITDINAPNDGTTNGFADIGGTSGSTPGAAGAMVLARQYFYDGFYPSGARSPSNGFNASGALLKAVAINGAEEMSGDNAYMLPYNSMAYPTNTQGWGRLNLDNALYFTGDNKGLIIDDNRTGLSTGETMTYDIDIVDSDEPLRITLVWTDYPGQPAAGKELVNDLDLEITAPDGLTVFKGNVLGGNSNPHHSVTGGAFDNTNVEENFINLTPTVGIWKVKVSAVNTPQGPQEYGLVISGNVTKPDDLAVTPGDIQFSTTELNENDDLTVYINFSNRGGADLPAVMAVLKLDGDTKLTKTLPLVGGRASFDYAWQATWGDHTFSVEVDPNDLIPESTETNNYAEKSIYVNKLPTAAFTTDVTDVYTFDTITVNATASDDDGKHDLRYKFSWGDGNETNWIMEPVQTHSYTQNDFYTVNLNVMDNRSFESGWGQPIYITVRNRGPWVNGSASTLEALTYENISFDASNSGDKDGTITYEWNFQDSSFSKEISLLHLWEDDGYYNVTLMVEDDDGVQNTTTILVHIKNRFPASYFMVTGNRGNVTTQFNFVPTVTDMDGEIVEFVWDFGDGNTSDEEAPTHHYSDDGTYNVTFYVLDDDGAESQMTNTFIEIYNLGPTANITTNVTEVLTYEPIKFESSSVDIDGAIVNYTWNLGDGTFFYGEELEHFFKQDGTYRINLKVMDDDFIWDETNITISVLNRAPVPVVEFNTTIIAGQYTILSASGSWDKDGSIISYLWKLGNETEKRTEVVNYTFWNEGVYNITLSVMDDDLSVSTTTFTILVQPPPPPPPGPKIPGTGFELGLTSLWLIIILVIVIVVVSILLFVNKQRKGRPGRGTSQGFDPNHSAAVPPMNAVQEPPPQNYQNEYSDHGQQHYDQDQWSETTPETPVEEVPPTGTQAEQPQLEGSELAQGTASPVQNPPDQGSG